MARWENEEPLAALDAQIRVMEHARSDCFTALQAAEQDVIASIAKRDAAGEASARLRAASARSGVRDFSDELAELRAERVLIVPAPRWPAFGS